MIVKRRWAARRLAEVGDGRSVEMVGGYGILAPEGEEGRL